MSVEDGQRKAKGAEVVNGTQVLMYLLYLIIVVVICITIVKVVDILVDSDTLTIYLPGVLRS